ncbi:MAG: V-type ATP synthase subunit I [Synergistaceae bacterium]|nr:V-type ATP synthase subunit I [Synergistaceae bacterium]MBR0250898.1 V-type ATP synthase subunit I [Synergistaceae bacterium]
MGVARLKKAELYYHKSVHEEIAAALQESGACQIISTATTEENSVNSAPPSEITALISQTDDKLSDIRYLSRTLNPHYVDPIPALDRMLGERPEATMNELAELASQTDLKKICEEVREIEHETGDVRAKLSEARMNESLLSSLEFFPYPLSVITEGTRTLTGLVGTLKAENVSGFRAALGDFSKFSQDTELVIAPFDEKDKSQEVCAALIYSRSIESEVRELCAKNGLSFAEVPAAFMGTVDEEKEKYAALITELESKEQELSAKMNGAADSYVPTVQKLSDYYSSLSSRYNEMARSYETDCTMLTTFWVPASKAADLRAKIEAISTDIELVMNDPAPEDELPSLLNNGDTIRPFNILTELYSSPTYRGIDPTPLLAPFFWIFFGMCLGDAGYALVVFGTILWVFKKYKKIGSGVKDFIRLFLFCSVSTFIYGVISGSFFGNFIDSFVPALIPLKNSLMLVDPMTNPMQVLGISLLIGVIHLMFGLLIAAYDMMRHGEFIDAIGSKVSWFLLIVGLCLLGVGMGGMLPPHFVQIGQGMAGLGAVIIFIYAGKGEPNYFKKIINGFLALYGSTSYLGDILSYSRLLALGFGSAVIGMVINLLGGLAADIPYIGWLIAIVVIVGGHIFSIAINILGSFVHPLRLQYVEFFGKFYTGGGEPFTPLTLSQEYINLKA